MAEEIRFLPEILAKVAANGDARFQHAMETIALKIEATMKEKVREGGVHQYGTPTPASPGSGPAVISGDLSRSITHQKVGEEYRIGPASIPHTQYGSRRGGGTNKFQVGRRRTAKGTNVTTGQIGEWLEKGTDKMPAYPFVQPALDQVKGEIEMMVKAEFEAPL